jgi:hypothetical protein
MKKDVENREILAAVLAVVAWMGLVVGIVLSSTVSGLGAVLIAMAAAVPTAIAVVLTRSQRLRRQEAFHRQAALDANAQQLAKLEAYLDSLRPAIR